MGLASEIGSLEVGKNSGLVVFGFRYPHLCPAVTQRALWYTRGRGATWQCWW